MENLKYIVIDREKGDCYELEGKVKNAKKIGEPQVDKRYLQFTLVPRDVLQRLHPEERVDIPSEANAYVELHSKKDDNFSITTLQFYKVEIEA